MNDLKQIFEKYATVVFFDTETNGLDCDNNQIIELAASIVKKTDKGLHIPQSCDLLVKLPEGQKLPQNIVELTGITDWMLRRSGSTEEHVAKRFMEYISNDDGPVLLVAHNAQFDLLFIRAMLARHNPKGLELLGKADYLDSLTVYKDRRAYPHKLANAIKAYKLQGKVANTHRALSDVHALYEVVKAMDNERADLLNYVNLFGYNPKYGVSGRRIEGVKYWPQRFNNYMQAPKFTLPVLSGKVQYPPRPACETTIND